jgi:YggT family protein
MLSALLRIIDIAFALYSAAIIARSLLSWFRVDPYHPAAQFLIQITEPLLAPIRRSVPPIGGLDLSPMLALLILWFIQQLLEGLLRTLFLSFAS